MQRRVSLSSTDRSPCREYHMIDILLLDKVRGEEWIERRGVGTVFYIFVFMMKQMN